MMMKRMNWMAIGVAGSMVAGCADAQGTPVVVMSQGELAAELATAPLRLEVTFNADGTVKEVEVEDEIGHGTEFEGKVSAFDATTGRLTIEVLGEVDVAAVTRYRTEERSDVDGATWFADLQAKLAAGEPAWVDARGAFAGELFGATELRFEDDEETKIEADVTAENFDPATGILKIGSLEVNLSEALIQTGDDSDEPSDREDGEDGDGHHDRDGHDGDGDDGDGDHQDAEAEGEHQDGEGDGHHGDTAEGEGAHDEDGDRPDGDEAHDEDGDRPDGDEARDGDGHHGEHHGAGDAGDAGDAGADDGDAQDAGSAPDGTDAQGG